MVLTTPSLWPAGASICTLWDVLSSKVSSSLHSALHSVAPVDPMLPTPLAPTPDAYQAAKDADKIADAAAIAAATKMIPDYQTALDTYRHELTAYVLGLMMTLILGLSFVPVFCLGFLLSFHQGDATVDAFYA